MELIIAQRDNLRRTNSPSPNWGNGKELTKLSAVKTIARYIANPIVLCRRLTGHKSYLMDVLKFVSNYAATHLAFLYTPVLPRFFLSNNKRGVNSKTWLEWLITLTKPRAFYRNRRTHHCLLRINLNIIRGISHIFVGNRHCATMTSFWFEYFSTFTDNISQHDRKSKQNISHHGFYLSAWNIHENDTLLADRNWNAQLEPMQIMNNFFLSSLT